MCSKPFCFTLLLLVSSSFCAAKQKCCPDGECYDLGLPWQSLLKRPVPEPRCIEDPAKYLLTSRSNPVYPSVFTTRNVSTISDFLNVQKPTVIVFHTWISSEASTTIRNLTAVYLSRVDANAIFVDYRKVAMNINYLQAVSDIRVVARYVVKMVQTIIQAGVSPAKIHLIGLNLGGHLAAYVAKAIPGIGRLTGLDPARILFTHQSCKVRLCRGDALFTETIHTSANPLWGFGTGNKDSDVNFWVNGGWDQPNCGVVVNPFALWELGKVQMSEVFADLFFCSLRRSLLYYIEALASNCIFWGVKADKFNLCISRLTLGYASKYIVHPRNCNLQTCVPIGLDTINATGRGNYIVATNYQQPFCVSR